MRPFSPRTSVIPLPIVKTVHALAAFRQSLDDVLDLFLQVFAIPLQGQVKLVESCMSRQHSI